MARLETGVIKHQYDWNGFYLRGDDALSLALLIKGYIESNDRYMGVKLEEWANRLLEVEDTPTPVNESGITASNTRIGGECDSPKSPDSDFANPQDVNRNKSPDRQETIL